MIAVGMVLIIVAIAGLVGGSIINYNIEMHSYRTSFYDGSNSPGTVLIFLGVIVLILGIIFVLVGVVKHNRVTNTDPRVKALYDLKFRGLITQHDFDEEISKINHNTYCSHGQKYCKKCGEKIENESVFCSKCGCKQSEEINL